MTCHKLKALEVQRFMRPSLELTHILEVVRVLAGGECECVEGMLVVFLSTKQKYQQM